MPPGQQPGLESTLENNFFRPNETRPTGLTTELQQTQQQRQDLSLERQNFPVIQPILRANGDRAQWVGPANRPPGEQGMIVRDADRPNLGTNSGLIRHIRFGRDAQGREGLVRRAELDESGNLTSLTIQDGQNPRTLDLSRNGQVRIGTRDYQVQRDATTGDVNLTSGNTTLRLMVNHRTGEIAIAANNNANAQIFHPDGRQGRAPAEQITQQMRDSRDPRDNRAAATQPRAADRPIPAIASEADYNNAANEARTSHRPLVTLYCPNGSPLPEQLRQISQQIPNAVFRVADSTVTDAIANQRMRANPGLQLPTGTRVEVMNVETNPPQGLVGRLQNGQLSRESLQQAIARVGNRPNDAGTQTPGTDRTQAQPQPTAEAQTLAQINQRVLQTYDSLRPLLAGAPGSNAENDRRLEEALRQAEQSDARVGSGLRVNVAIQRIYEANNLAQAGTPAAAQQAQPYYAEAIRQLVRVAQLEPSVFENPRIASEIRGLVSTTGPSRGLPGTLGDTIINGAREGRFAAPAAQTNQSINEAIAPIITRAQAAGTLGSQQVQAEIQRAIATAVGAAQSAHASAEAVRLIAQLPTFAPAPPVVPPVDRAQQPGTVTPPVVNREAQPAPPEPRIRRGGHGRAAPGFNLNDDLLDGPSTLPRIDAPVSRRDAFNPETSLITAEGAFRPTATADEMRRRAEYLEGRERAGAAQLTQAQRAELQTIRDFPVPGSPEARERGLTDGYTQEEANRLRDLSYRDWTDNRQGANMQHLYSWRCYPDDARARDIHTRTMTGQPVNDADREYLRAHPTMPTRRMRGSYHGLDLDWNLDRW
jgi:hypothetical protein